MESNNKLKGVEPVSTTQNGYCFKRLFLETKFIASDLCVFSFLILYECFRNFGRFAEIPFEELPNDGSFQFGSRVGSLSRARLFFQWDKTGSRPPQSAVAKRFLVSCWRASDASILVQLKVRQRISQRPTRYSAPTDDF